MRVWGTFAKVPQAHPPRPDKSKFEDVFDETVMKFYCRDFLFAMITLIYIAGDGPKRERWLLEEDVC